MSGWASVPFGSLYAEPSKNGLMAPSRTRGSGTALVNMGEIFAYERIGSQKMELAPIRGGRPNDWLIKTGDLLFARQSLKFEGAGKCVLVVASDFPRTFESHLIRVRLNVAAAEPVFYFYYFMSPAGRENMYSIIEQVAAAGIRSSDLSRLLVPMPDLSEQRRIASVLSAIDDKVASNERVVHIGQDLMRALVEQAIETSTGPEGTLAHYCDLIRTPARKESLDGSQHYVGLEHVPRGSLFVSDWSDSTALGSDKSAFAAGDILFGKLRPYFKKVGIAPIAGVCSTDILVVRPRDRKLTGFVAAVCGSDALIDHVTSASTGTRMPRASWADLADWRVPILADQERSSLVTDLVPLVDRLTALVLENQHLLDLRKVLLSELFEGRITAQQGAAI